MLQIDIYTLYSTRYILFIILYKYNGQWTICNALYPDLFMLLYRSGI